MEIGRNCVSIISTMLVSQNVICFGYFKPMSHCVNEKAPKSVPPPLLLTMFSLSLFVLLQEILYQSFFAGRYWFCCFVYMGFLRYFFTVLPSWNYEQLHVYTYARLTIWHLIKSCGITKEIYSHGPKIRSCCCFFVFPVN